MPSLTFAGSSIGEPWSICGGVAGRALARYGYDVTVAHDSNSHRNIPYVIARRAEIGATTPRHLVAARSHQGDHAADSVDEIAALAVIRRPQWLAIAVRPDLGVRDLRDIARARMPVRIFAGTPAPGEDLDVVLRHHGFTIDDVADWGGKHLRWHAQPRDFYVREGVADVLIAWIYVGYTPTSHHWLEATVLKGFRFLDLEADLIDRLLRLGHAKGVIPEGLLPGIDRDIPSVVEDTIVIYGRRDLPDDRAETVVRALDEGADLFSHARIPLYYERERVGVCPELPLHPAAQRYYRSRGYLPRLPHDGPIVHKPRDPAAAEVH